MFFFFNNIHAQDWESEFYRNHSLVGKVWDTEKDAWISDKRLLRELLQYDYILLGETHTNIDHHQLQARIIDYLVANGRKPTVVMEMLSKESWVAQPSRWSDIAELQEQAKLHNEGWPWDLYAPILESVVAHQLELAAGNIGSKALHEWSNKIGPFASKEVMTEYWVTTSSYEQLKQEIVESHCGHANAAFVDFMARAQLQRDRIMASSIVNRKSPVVFIAGAGHVRNDFAVPMQLLNSHHKVSYLSVAFIEVHPELSVPTNYLDDGLNKFDVLYFTPSHSNQDPCVKFRKQLQNMQNKSTQQ